MEALKKTVSIGIFAHDEAANIVATLDSLARQDALSSELFDELTIKVSVLANGCTDDTVAVAEAYLSTGNICNAQVLVIDKPGKSNAWNEFIHSADSASIDFFICMDSDIKFGSNNVISTLVKRLSSSDEAYLAVDIAEKDTLLKVQKTLYEKFSLFFSRLMKRGSTAVAGSLYCGKGDKLRMVHMPAGLPVEDGFLRAMLVTDLFTKKENNQRILVVNDVCHYFTPDSSIRSLFRHEERLLIGTFINSVIYNYLWQQVALTKIDAGSLVAKNNKQKPNWVEQLISNYRDSNDPLIPMHFYRKYWRQWGRFNLVEKIFTFPVIVMVSAIKYYLLKKVERRLVNDSGLGHW